MQINNGAFRGIRNIRAIIAGVILSLVGLLFIGLGIYFFLRPSEEDQNKATNFIFIGLGAVALLVGILTLVKTIKKMKQKPLTAEEVKQNEEQEALDGAKSINLVDTKLHFHFGGKMNQSYLVEDRNGKLVFECKLMKFNPFGANTFDFINHENNTTKTFKMGKPVSQESDGGPILVGDTLSSYFKIDGVECWDYLRNKGIEIKHMLQGKSIFRYEVDKLGKPIANIYPADLKDPFNSDSGHLFRMPKGSYRLEFIDGKLEDVVMAAFVITQTQMVQ